MVRRKAGYCLMLLVVGLAGVQMSAADCMYSQMLQVHWKRTRKMLTEIVAAMPEDKYDFRPVKSVRSFREIVMHMITDTYSHIGFVAGMSHQESDKLTEKYKNLKTRDEYLKAMGESYDFGDKVLGDLTDKSAMEMVTGMRQERMTRVEAALVAFEDAMDHYGNLVVYLRMNGVVPPDTANSPMGRRQAAQAEEHEHQH